MQIHTVDTLHHQTESKKNTSKLYLNQSEQSHGK